MLEDYSSPVRRERDWLGWTVGIATLAMVVPALSDSQAATAKIAPPKAAAARPTEPALTPGARQALADMGNYLRTLKSFELTATGTGEEVAAAGQKLEYGAQLHYVVSLPDKLYAEVSTGSRSRHMTYDGSKFTVSADDVGYYTDIPMTGSLPTLLAKASDNYGIELPLHELFRWGDSQRPPAPPKSGFKVGTAKCGDAICDQFAYRDTGVDWQLWIRQGAMPLPVRLVFTDTLDPARPQIAADLTWKLDGDIPADRFTFVPGKGAIRIPIKSATAALGSTK